MPFKELNQLLSGFGDFIHHADGRLHGRFVRVFKSSNDLKFPITAPWLSRAADSCQSPYDSTPLRLSSFRREMKSSRRLRHSPHVRVTHGFGTSCSCSARAAITVTSV